MRGEENTKPYCCSSSSSSFIHLFFLRTPEDGPTTQEQRPTQVGVPALRERTG